MKIRIIYDYLFLIILLGFVVFKLTHIDIPFFWDESWVYGPAIQIMSDNGPGLLPSAMQEYISRGHPLLFHFLGGLWIKLFGSSLTSIHLFPLLFSVALLIVLYLFGRNNYSPEVGFYSFIFLVVQPAFLAQSAMVLPEIMLSFWIFVAIISYLKGNKLLYTISATLALFTKESALVFVFIILAFELTQILFSKNNRKEKIRKIQQMYFLFLPLFLIFIFFLIQYFQKGWFFYPEHTGMIDLSWFQIHYKLSAYFEYLNLKNGNSLITILLIFSFFYLLLFNRKVLVEYHRVLLLFLASILGYAIFSSINFFTSRYLLSVFPLFVVISSLLWIRLKAVWWIKIPVLTIIISFSLSFSFLPSKFHQGDTNMGYLDGIRVHQQAIDFMVSQGFQGKKIYTHFLMINQLKNYRSRYLLKEETFKNVHSSLSENIELIVYSSFEREFDPKQIIATEPFELLERFESGKAFTEIYIRILPQDSSD